MSRRRRYGRSAYIETRKTPSERVTSDDSGWEKANRSLEELADAIDALYSTKESAPKPRDAVSSKQSKPSVSPKGTQSAPVQQTTAAPRAPKAPPVSHLDKPVKAPQVALPQRTRAPSLPKSSEPAPVAVAQPVRETQNANLPAPVAQSRALTSTDTPNTPSAPATPAPLKGRDVQPVQKRDETGKEILVCPAPPRPGQTWIDMLMGLAVRLALVIQFGSWMFANTAPITDLLDWQSWFIPEPGLQSAVTVWTMGQIDAQTGALVLVVAAGLIALSAGLGLFARLAGFLVMIGALWHALFVLPEAWPMAFTHGVLGFYLAFRGAGPASLDWILARLSRMG